MCMWGVELLQCSPRWKPVCSGDTAGPLSLHTESALASGSTEVSLRSADGLLAVCVGEGDCPEVAQAAQWAHTQQWPPLDPLQNWFWPWHRGRIAASASLWWRRGVTFVMQHVLMKCVFTSHPAQRCQIAGSTTARPELWLHSHTVFVALREYANASILLCKCRHVSSEQTKRKANWFHTGCFLYLQGFILS